MKINYNIDHKYLDLEIFKEKRTTLQGLILLITLSQIAHFSKSKVGSCTFRVNDMAKDFGCDKRYFSDRLKELQKADLIKCIKPYQRKTQESGIYVTTENFKKQMKKLGYGVHQAGVDLTSSRSTLYTGKELVNNSKQEEDDLTSPLPLMEKVWTNNNEPGI